MISRALVAKVGRMMLNYTGGTAALACCLAVLLATSAVAQTEAKVAERLRTDPYMTPAFTGRILPEPKLAEYGSEFFSLEKAGILLGKGVTKGDARLALLVERITQYGGGCEIVASPQAECCGRLRRPGARRRSGSLRLNWANRCERSWARRSAPSC